MGSTISRPIERDVQLPLFVRRWATPSSERTPFNPLDRTVYQRGKLYGLREATGDIVDYIRCQTCGELKSATHYNFALDARNKSGYEHVCRDCRNGHRRAYRRDYMRMYRERKIITH